MTSSPIAYVFGNSPSCNTSKIILPPDKKIVLGQGINFLKNSKIDYWFTRAAQFDEETSKLSDTTIILSARANKKQKNVIEFTDDEVIKFSNKKGFNSNPSLGIFAVLYLQQFFEKIRISGITLKINEPCITGYFWNLKERRLNSYHNLLDECLFLNKLIKTGKLHEF
jgi:hypothetical protein